MSLTPPPSAPPAAPDAAPTAPARSDPSTFRARADAFVSWQGLTLQPALSSFRTWLASFVTWLGTNVTELGALQTDVAGKQSQVATDAAQVSADKATVASDKAAAQSIAAGFAQSAGLVNWLDNPGGEVFQRTQNAATADDNYLEDRWYALTQTGTIAAAQLFGPEDGYGYGVRILQQQATNQRMGEAQIVESLRTGKLRGRTVTFGGRFRLSATGNVRIAVLAWTGTADVVTSDVVNNWTSTNYTTGNFFISSGVTLLGAGVGTLTANTPGSISTTVTIPSGANNIIVVYWTEAAVAQNVTLDAWGRRIVEASSLVPYINRSETEERMRCQRRYWRFTGAAGNNSVCGQGVVETGGTSAYINWTLPVTMAAAPTYIPGAGSLQVYDGTTLSNLSTVASSHVTPDNYTIVYNLSATLTAGRAALFLVRSGAYIEFSCDL